MAKNKVTKTTEADIAAAAQGGRSNRTSPRNQQPKRGDKSDQTPSSTSTSSKPPDKTSTKASLKQSKTTKVLSASSNDPTTNVTAPKQGGDGSVSDDRNKIDSIISPTNKVAVNKETSTVVAATEESKVPSTETNSSDKNTGSTKSRTSASVSNAGTAADAASAAADGGGVFEAQEDATAAAAAADAAATTATTAQTTVAAVAPGNDSFTVTKNDAKAATDTASASGSHKTPSKQSTARNGSSLVTPDQNTLQYTHARYECGSFTEDIINNSNLLALNVMVTKDETTGEMVTLPANQTNLDHQKMIEIQSTFAGHFPQGPKILNESSLAIYISEKRDRAEVNEVSKLNSTEIKSERYCQ